ncbi:hypothetical protein GCM10028813_48530 [Ramlibacter alkalitolerans]
MAKQDVGEGPGRGHGDEHGKGTAGAGRVENGHTGNSPLFFVNSGGDTGTLVDSSAIEAQGSPEVSGARDTPVAAGAANLTAG